MAKKLSKEEQREILREQIITENKTINSLNTVDKSGNPQEITLDSILGKEIVTKYTTKVIDAIKGNVITIQEIKELYSQFTRVQKERIKISNQLFALKTKMPNTEFHMLEHLLSTQITIEGELKLFLQAAAESSKIGKYLLSIKGIGPTLAAAWLSSVDITKANSPGAFISYCGLNDYNKPKYNEATARSIVTEAIEQYPDQSGNGISDDAIVAISMKTGRRIQFLLEHGTVPLNPKDEKSKIRYFSKEKLISGLLQTPYSPEMKTLCYKTSDQFIKVMNRGSLYGRLYLERKAYETQKNENLDYKHQAEVILSKKKFDKNSKAYQYYSNGMLPPAHIMMRCRRYIMRIFVTHLFEAMYIDYNKRPAPTIYPIAFLDHKDYIEPEHPYAEFGIVPDEGSVQDPRYNNPLPVQTRIALDMHNHGTNVLKKAPDMKAIKNMSDEEIIDEYNECVFGSEFTAGVDFSEFDE